MEFQDSPILDPQEEPMEREQSQHRFSKWQLGSLTFVHFMVDFYGSMLPPLLPLIVAKFSISLALVGPLVSTYLLSSSLVQPLFGLLSDRLQGRLFIFLGPLFTATFVCLIGWSPSYAFMVVFLFLAGLGISAFHPQATAVVGQEAGQKRATSISIFLFGGTLGFAVSPLVVTSWTSSYGLNSIFVVGIPGIISVLLCRRFVAYSNLKRERGRKSGVLRDLRAFLRPFTVLFTIVTVTSVLRLGIASFMPLLLTARGVSLPEVGVFLSACALLGSTGSVVAAMAAGRWGRKRVMLIALVLCVPLFQYYFIEPGVIGLILIVFGSAGVMSPYSIIVAIGQEALPHRSGIVSAMLMGFGWGVAGLIMTPMGMIAETIGLAETLRWSTYLPLVAALTLVLLPEDGSVSGRA